MVVKKKQTENKKNPLLMRLSLYECVCMSLIRQMEELLIQHGGFFFAAFLDKTVLMKWAGDEFSENIRYLSAFSFQL